MFCRQQKQCSILHQQNLTSNPNRAVSFHHLPEVLKTKSPTPPAQQIYLPLRFCVTRVFFPTTKGGSSKRCWEQGYSSSWCHQLAGTKPLQKQLHPYGITQIEFKLTVLEITSVKFSAMPSLLHYHDKHINITLPQLYKQTFTYVSR